MAMMASSSLFSVSVNGTVRHLAGELHVFEIAFFRNLFLITALVPLIGRSGGFVSLRTRRFRLHALRAALNVVSTISLYAALSVAPLAQVAALNFTTPLFTTLGAVLILREKMTRVRATGLTVGFIGAMIIVRPGFEVFSAGAGYVLLSACSWALALLAIKSLTRTESSVNVTFYGNVLGLPVMLLLAATVWQLPSWEQLAWLACSGLLGTLTHLTLNEAFRGADITYVLPVSFSKLIWASLIGYLAFAEMPDVWTWTGGVVIFSGVASIALAENRNGRRARSAGKT